MTLQPLWTDHFLYVVDYDAPEFARFEFDHLRETSDGDIRAEVVIRSTKQAHEETLYEGKVNLLAGTTVKGIAKDVRERANGQGDLDWHGMFARACQETKRAFRKGEPGMLLRDAPETDRDDFLIPHLLLDRHPTIFFGRGGSVKSLMALALGVAVHTGRGDLVGITPLASKRVLLLDWEFDATEHKRRLRQLCGDELPDIAYARCRGALRNQVDRIKGLVREYGSEFLIVDSIGPAIGGDPLSSEVALGFFEGIRAVGLGALCIAHIAKNGDEETPFGSAFFENMARKTWLLKKADGDPNDDAVTIGMFNKKVNVGRFSPPHAFRFAWGDGRVGISQVDPRDVDGLSGAVTLGERAKRLLELEGRAMTNDEIAEALSTDAREVSSATIRKTMERLHAKRDVLVLEPLAGTKSARWGLPGMATRIHRPDDGDLPWPD